MESSSRPTSNTDTCTYQIDFPTPQDQPEALRDLATRILAFTNSLSANYLWHKQPFELAPTALSYAAPIEQKQHLWLEGKTDVTDAVDDEWFIVWLLQQISLQWTEAVIAIEDDDGEFLLIEAADVLPNWVTPQNAANRLWIYQGRLHLIPLDHKSEMPFAQGDSTLNPSFDPEEDGFLDRSTAVELVRDSQINTLAPEDVQEAVWARIKGYPRQADEHHHNTLTYLPTDLALALEDSPQLITEAVGAFYERDPAMLRACNTMTRFPPTSPLASSELGDSDPTLPSTVLVQTRLTRPLYSQLLLQKFYAPKPFEKVGWTEGKLGEQDVRRRDLGMKIACGFEMLYKQTTPIPRVDTTSTTDLSSNLEYQAMLKSLEDKGFFEGVGIKGSQEWSEREKNVREAWIKSRTNSPQLSFAQKVDEAIARAKSRPTALAQRVQNPVTLSEDKVRELHLEDSEAWLEIDQADLENILRSREPNKFEEEGFSDEESDGEEVNDAMNIGEETRPKTREEREEDRRNRRAAKQLEDMAGKVEDFVQGRGTVQGAVFDDERSDDDGEDSEDEQEEDDVEMPEMTSEERASRLEKLVAPLPISEWGQNTASTSSAPSTIASDVAATTTSSTRTPRPAKFEAEKYDGASSDSDSSDEAMPGEEGLDAINEDEAGNEDEEQPAVMDEEDMLDMGEEMDEFLKFATETLGLSEEQYQGILGERKQRGAFVPGPAKSKKTNVVPSASESASSARAPPSVPRTAPIPRQPSRNPNLADFDSLMEQMEKELSHVKKASTSTAPPKVTKPSSKTTKPSTTVKIETLSDSEEEDGIDDDDHDVERMDAELQQMLKDMGGQGDGGTMDYNLVKNFLDSFQSQGGFAGPAGNLSGRLGFNMPRDRQ
ncbi:uncharacterized protein JCM15063_005536 [Sporobolomyces koalae]|uniref:uncharacterized protein n=1 Tax=Sporobolomyces koalae TaxID=500713 RepID=UPI003181A0C9